MNKIVPGVILSAIILGISMVTFQQYKVAEKNAKQVSFQNKEVAYLEENLTLQINENEALEEENYFLEEQLKGARDSVVRVSAKLATLRTNYSKKQKEWQAANQQLRELKRKYIDLQARLDDTSSDGGNAAVIEQLKSDKRSLLQEMLSLRKLVTKTDLAIENNPISKFLPKDVQDVTANSSAFNVEMLKTKVLLNKVTLHKRKLGKAIQRIGKKSDWKYTHINLTLDHPMPELLEGQNFKAKIIETQTGNVLSFVESNPTFPNSSLDSKGIGFQYENENVELTYYNADHKAAKDYHLAIFMVDTNGTEHTLPGGNVPLVKRGKVVQ